MFRKAQDYFIGHHLRKTDDVFEHARAIMIYRFSLMFLLLFILPFATDIVLHYDKLVILHSIDLIAIAAFPFMMRKIEKIDTQIMIFFILTTASSFTIFLMANPMKFDLIGISWIIFFSTLSALLLKGVRRLLFSVLLPWLPLVYIGINVHLNGALTVSALVQENAAEPPLFLMCVPITLLIYAVWSHTLTIAKARNTITQQRNEIQNKNKNITDSINYARHLQDALLPDLESIRGQFPQSEVYYRPKDIVAGDFYWMEKAGTKVFIAAADCTGHGVPGAMVSVVCSGALTRSVREFGCNTTSQILNKTRELVKETFDQNKGDVSDGMDISLLCVDRSTGEVTWSGANNPLWIVNEHDITIIKGDKQPVGRGVSELPFSSHPISIGTGSTIYLITDGLADQFGGPEGKKLRYKPIMQFLVENHPLQPAERVQKLDEMFRRWKGDLEQVDDICILAITL